MKVLCPVVLGLSVFGLIGCGGSGEVREDVGVDAPADTGVDAVADAAPDAVDAAMDAGDAAMDTGDAAMPVLVPSLFAIDDSGGAPGGWFDLTSLSAGQAPDVLLDGLGGSEASAVTRHGGNLIVATDDNEQRVLVWNDAQSLVADQLADVTLTDIGLGLGFTPSQIFSTVVGDLWLSSFGDIARIVDGANGGTTTVSFTPVSELTTIAFDEVGGTLFASGETPEIAGYEDALSATGVDNTSTWNFFMPDRRPLAFAIGGGRLYAGSKTGPGGGATLRIWNDISTLSGPAAVTPDVTFSDGGDFVGYVALVLTDDDHLVGVFESGGTFSVHVFANASALTTGATPMVIDDALFDGMTSIAVSKTGTLYGATGDLVVVPNVTTTPGTPFTMDYFASAVVVID